MKRNITKLLYTAVPLWLIIVFLLTMSNGCSKAKDDYYSRPSDLAGPLWEQLTANGNFSKFTKAVEGVSELKRIINTSGLYTVFAPTDAAWDKYVTDKGFASFDAFFAKYNGTFTLKQLVNYHIIYNMWYSCDFIANIDLEDLESDDSHRYTTRSKDLYDTVWYKIDKEGKYVIVDLASQATTFRVVRKPEKVLNIYMENYIVKQDIVADYKQIYGVDYTYFNVDGAQVILQLNGTTEIYKKEDLIKNAKGKIKNEGSVKQMYDLEAENGAIHAINRVLTPTANIEVTIGNLCQKSVLATKPDSVKYMDLLNRFIQLTFDQTNSAAENKNTSGGLDSLFNKSYVDKDEVSLGFDFSSETSNITLFLPTNEALQNFFISKISRSYDLVTTDQKLSKQEFDSISDYTLRLIINASIVKKMTWPTKKTKAVVSLAGDTINKVAFPSVQAIVPASNGIVYLVNEVVEPSAFSTVAKLPLLNSNFRLLSKVLEYTGLYDYLTYNYQQLTFFAPTDAALKAGKITYGYVTTDGTTVGQFYFQSKKVRKETLDSLLRFCILREKYSYEALATLAATGPTFLKTRHGSYIALTQEVVSGTTVPGVLIGKDGNATAKISTNATEHNIECTNGYIHVVNAMPLAPLKTVASVIAELSNTKLFLKVLKAQKISTGSSTTILDMLGDPDAADRYTVLAPCDSLMNQLGDTSANSSTIKSLRMWDTTAGVYSNVIWRKVAFAHIIPLSIFSDGTNIGKDIDGSYLYAKGDGSPVNNTLATFSNGLPYQVRVHAVTNLTPFGFESANNQTYDVDNAHKQHEIEMYYLGNPRYTLITYKVDFIAPTQINLQAVNGVVHVANYQKYDIGKEYLWYNFEEVFQ